MGRGYISVVKTAVPKVSTMKCHMCGDKGMKGGCPRCGRKYKKVEVNRTVAMESDLVPSTYVGKVWSRQDSNILYERQFEDTLDKVYAIFLDGRIPGFSMFIGAPCKYDKFLFAYACMQSAMLQGHMVAPVLSVSDWRRLYKISQMNPMYKLYGRYLWDDLIVKDVLFLFIDDSEDRYDCIGMLKTLYDIRATFSLPTFVLSDYKLTSLVNRYRSEEYTKIYNPNPERDFYRFPVVVHRME